VDAALERRLLDAFQRGFPLCERPWAEIARRLGVGEPDVLAAVARYLADGVLSRVGAVFRPNVIGTSTLAAIAVPPDRLDAVAAIVSARPEVNHNYAREHAVNLWFVAAAADARALDQALAAIERDARLPVLRLPLVRDYWIDLGFPLDGASKHGGIRVDGHRVAPVALDAKDRRLVAALERGLAPEPRPWLAPARQAGVSEAYALVRVADWLNRGVIRRFGLVVRHRALGWHANAMCVWDVPDERADALGEALAREDDVTLAYRRERASGWPHNLYAMIHGRDRATVVARRNAIARSIGLDAHPHATLFSTRAYTQRGARYAARARNAPEPSPRPPGDAP
jgi:DNA-binding Lrp family transcriptional regulator